MRRWVFLIVMIFLVVGAAVPWERLYEIPIASRRTYLDQLDNVYTIRLGEVRKFDGNGQELSRYSNRLIGDDVRIDVSNPLKVTLFSPDQMMLMFLDSRLGLLREPINLMKIGYDQISLAATSHTNGVWLYDPIKFQLIRLNANLEEERRSLNLAQLSREQLYPTDLLEVNNKVYLCDPAHGIFVFDIFGNYLRKLPMKDVHTLCVNDSRLFFMRDKSLLALNLIYMDEELVMELDQPPVFFYVNRNRLAITREEGIIIYRYKP